eukprot:TRINITY_DN2999_c0_g1_i1.p1 TRINITY_DN2999_c0_g1~~TRINITY_DN2999_c0_g1_i1.p1  ORF type:complete len:191 (+),score=47.10 TRINITY_DN2999_c0_g1_i1:116-688(+)
MNQPPNQDTYKDIPNQNYIEVRFAQKNIEEISKDEALLRYKRNSYLIGRIFSYNQDIKEEANDDSKQSTHAPSSQISIETLTENNRIQTRELEAMKNKHKEKLEHFENKNKVYQQVMDEAKHLRSPDQFDDFKKKLMENNLYSGDHPFFMENSPFFLSTDDTIIKRVEAPVYIDDRYYSWDKTDLNIMSL